MFHVELRQFPNAARAFNLSEPELHDRFLANWVAERVIDYDDRRWSPEKARLTVYEAPRLPPEEMGMGRGWANVTKAGREVTEEVVAHARRGGAGGSSDAAVQTFKSSIEERAAIGSLSLEQVLSLAATQNAGRRVSEQLAIAEQAVWELLHQRRIGVFRAGEEVPEDEWQLLLLTLSTWTRRAPGIEIRPRDP
ncbi:MAG TPA: hypothetical protein VGI87_11315 [Solirubrobacteraceae bacterium]